MTNWTVQEVTFPRETFGYLPDEAFGYFFLCWDNWDEEMARHLVTFSTETICLRKWRGIWLLSPLRQFVCGNDEAFD